MPLPRLPPDPTPTAEDMIRLRIKTKDIFYMNDVERIAMWRWQKSGEYPDMFRVPFSSNVREWPDASKTYKEYLDNPLWRSIRKEVLGDPPTALCVGCLDPATRVHHRDYRPRVLRGEDKTPLVPICEGCHTKVHADDKKLIETKQFSLIDTRREQILADLVQESDRKYSIVADMLKKAKAELRL